MIGFNELIKGHNIADIPILHQQNLEETLKASNIIRTAWGKPMTCTSGYRSMQDHLRIYSEKMGKNFDPKKVPMHSHHLYGEAADFSDPNLELTAWLKTPEGVKVAEQANVFFEEGNSNWLHVQTRPFGSYVMGGTRWFKP
jgi:hypothetical protein